MLQQMQNVVIISDMLWTQIDQSCYLAIALRGTAQYDRLYEEIVRFRENQCNAYNWYCYRKKHLQTFLECITKLQHKLWMHDDKERLQKVKLPQQERRLLDETGIEVSKKVIEFTEDAKKLFQLVASQLEQLHAKTVMHEEIQKQLCLLRRGKQTRRKQQLYNDLLEVQKWEQELIGFLEQEQHELRKMLEEQVCPNSRLAANSLNHCLSL